MKFDQVTYERWRSEIPWTNEQIASGLDKEAERCGSEWVAQRYRWSAARLRAGVRLSGKALSAALPSLALVCDVEGCGKTALYRFGCEGRCRDHRHLVSLGVATRRARIEAASEVYESERVTADRLDKLRRAHLRMRSPGAVVR